ncbi:uncharacterized protein E0L32_001266 [Thyridium curvatum]|uniref:Uncharacterized protein n=1 Tax=Thyridium curvatum TaxID=1093900 RepID=A0A507AYH3_9PEZI|nr:uncharacterized protein E0L32_001266 [Thyridium curvatum]TPX10069.1 hypothetical protein E0L32_001266 [Thyridium curvatum]
MWHILSLFVCALVADAALSEAWSGHEDRFTVAQALRFQPQVCQVADLVTNRTTADSHVTQRSARARSFRKGRCYPFSHEKFCTYTNRHFKQGEDVSIITTEERFHELSRLSVFQDDIESINEQPWLRDTKRFKDVQIPGKGIGLIATQPIRTGHQVLSRSPAVMLDGRAVRTANRAGLASLLQHAAADLPEPHRSEFFKLSKHDHVSNPGEDSYDIFATNAFRTTIPDQGWEFHSIFTEAESDARITSIHQLWKELDDYSPESTASPDKAELLIQLVELEGAMGRMHEAYYRAALEWNGVGEAVKAIRVYV